MADTLQEFLVSLKYKQEGRQNFLSGIEDAENTVMRLGKALVTGGLAIGLFMGKYAQHMEQIGFVARRTGTHVKNLMAFEQAGASLGSSAQGAQGSLEELAAFIRNTPGSSGFLKELGVQTKDAKGHALDTVNIMEQLGKSFQKMPVYMAHQYASLLGISDHMMLALRSGKVPGLVSKFRKPLEGGKLDTVTLAANTAMINARVLGMKKESVEAKAGLPVLTAFDAADQATKGLSTDLLALAKYLAGASVAVMLFKGATGLFGGGAEKGAEGALRGGIFSRLGKILGFGMRGVGVASASIGGWEAGKWLDKNIPDLHDAIVSTLQTLHIVPSLNVVHAYGSQGPYATPGNVTTHHHVTNHQTVTVNVNGAKDAHETARRVTEELRMAAHNNNMASH